MGILKRVVRGIRDTIPGGYIIGRVASTDGPAQLIDFRALTLAQQAVMPGGQLSSPSGGTADFGFFFQGKPSFSNMILAGMTLTKAVKLAAGLTGSKFNADNAPTSDYTVTLTRNGASLGTIKFAAGTGAVTITFASAVTLHVNDEFKIVGPVAADPAIQDIDFNFSATFA